MEFEELKAFGLDDNEITIYIACLKKKNATVKYLAKETNLIRTTIYGVLLSLSKKGLISKVKKEGILEFHAANPDELINILDNKKSIIESVLPNLKNLSLDFEKSQKIELFEGINGVKTVTNDIISKENQTVKILGAISNWLSFSQAFTTVYYRKKKERNVKTKTILTDNKQERKTAKNPNVKNSTFRFTKNIDLTKSATYIYDNKVSFVTFEKNQARGFIIEDKEFNKIMNEVFESIWKKAEK